LLIIRLPKKPLEVKELIKRTIYLNHAYDGLLYAPLFVAQDLGFFPQNVQVRYVPGDSQTMHKLVEHDDGEDNWFSICDPFVKEMSEITSAVGAPDPISIVGVLIQKLPLWLYSTDRDLQTVTAESQLTQYNDRIKTVRCYRNPNTGWLIAKRIIEMYLPNSNPLQVDFGKEFDELTQDSLVVTADILRIHKEINAARAFNYAGKPTDLNPYLFTAILTRKSIVNDHLGSVVSVLEALRRGVLELSRDSDDAIQALAKRYKRDSQEIRNSISILTRERIYPTTFEVDTAKVAYDNARNEWKRRTKKDFSEVTESSEPIPSLLIANGWRHEKRLAGEFAKEWGGKTDTVEAVARGWASKPDPVRTATRIWLDNSDAQEAMIEAWRENPGAVGKIIAPTWGGCAAAAAVVAEGCQESIQTVKSVATVWRNHQAARNAVAEVWREDLDAVTSLAEPVILKIVWRALWRKKQEDGATILYSLLAGSVILGSACWMGRAWMKTTTPFKVQVICDAIVLLGIVLFIGSRVTTGKSIPKLVFWTAGLLTLGLQFCAAIGFALGLHWLWEMSSNDLITTEIALAVAIPVFRVFYERHDQSN
jgi:hypothetical protein